MWNTDYFLRSLQINDRQILNANSIWYYAECNCLRAELFDVFKNKHFYYYTSFGLPGSYLPCLPPYSGHCWSPMVYHNGTFCLNFSRYILYWKYHELHSNQGITNTVRSKSLVNFSGVSQTTCSYWTYSTIGPLYNESILKNSYLWNKLYKNILICKKRI